MDIIERLNDLADGAEEISEAALWLAGLAEANGEADKAAQVREDAATLSQYGTFCRSLATRAAEN